MYSGITQGVFLISAVDKKPGIIHYEVLLNSALTKGLKIGASINVDGVCQTVTQIKGSTVCFSAMAETCRLTSLKDLFAGRKVSIERSLRYGDEIGGHEVAGHVTGVAAIHKILTAENNLTITLQCPREWMKFILYKGFIAVDGSSLTIGETDPQGFFNIHLIPETLRVTNLGNKQIGDLVNIELDRTTQTIVTTVERIVGYSVG